MCIFSGDRCFGELHLDADRFESASATAVGF